MGYSFLEMDLQPQCLLFGETIFHHATLVAFHWPSIVTCGFIYYQKHMYCLYSTGTQALGMPSLLIPVGPILVQSTHSVNQ